MTNRTNKEYFDWLVSQIEIAGNSARTYNELFEIMFGTEFIWAVDGDDNRAQDGMDLRGYFSGGVESHRPDIQGVTVLEVLIGLSRKVAFVAGGDAREWAWQLIVNLGLDRCTDPLTRFSLPTVNACLSRLVLRTYDPDGRGGFFPLNNPQEDQRQIEIWKQLNEYVNEIQEPI